MEASSFIDAASPLHFISKVFGYSPFSINQHDFSIALRAIDVLMIITTIVVNSLLNFFFWGASADRMGAIHMSDIIRKSLPIIIGCSYVLYLLTMVVLFAKRKSVAGIFKTISIVDETFAELNVRFDHGRHRRMGLCTLLVVTLINIAMIAQFNIALFINRVRTHHGWNIFAYFWCLQAQTVLILNFALLALTARLRFAALNELMARRRENLETQQVRTLATIHFEICNLIKFINSTLAPLVMLYFGGIFCIFNLFLFSVVTIKSYYGDYGDALWLTAVNVQWNAYDVVLIVIVCHFTTSATREGKRSANVLHKILNASSDDGLNCRLMNFSRQIASCRLDFSCGLFHYNWTLLFKIVCCSCGFVVILIQFDSVASRLYTSERGAH